MTDEPNAPGGASRRQAGVVGAPGGASRRQAGVVRAPARVNLIGDHTDYQDGMCLPMAIERAVRVAWTPRDDRRVTVTSRALAGHVARIPGDYQSGMPSPTFRV